jgi:DNA-3-methyladenine glycosylase I
VEQKKISKSGLLKINMKKGDCSWTGSDILMQEYHDTEWAVPCYDDKMLFEYFILETFQAGLSWQTIIHKREGFKKAFFDFDIKKCAQLSDREIENLCDNENIIRHKGKIESVRNNARVFLEIQKEFDSFSSHLWSFVNNTQENMSLKKEDDARSFSDSSLLLSKDMKKRGFKFVGPTVCYAYMQAVGMVNDHLVTCSQYEKCLQKI